MFDSIQPRPRGFIGRPAAALLFAVGAGIFTSYLGTRFHLGDALTTVLGPAAIGIAGLGWYWVERPK